MHSPRTTSPARRPRVSGVARGSFHAAVMVVSIGVLSGCQEIDVTPGAETFMEALRGPPPALAAEWAIDPYDADKRFRGTLLLANAVFAGQPVYMRLFTDNAKDADPAVRGAALRAIANHGTPEQAGILVEALKDEDASVRLEAARGLQRLHAPPAVDALMGRLKPDVEDEPRVRAEAAEALGQYPERRVLQALIAALADRQLLVNDAASRSLQTLTGQNFGFAQASWVEWLRGAGDPFVAGAVYEFPAFSRDKFWYEYFPFFPPPPNEVSRPPTGYPRVPKA